MRKTDRHPDLCFKEDERVPLNKKQCFVARIFSPVGLVARPVDLGQMLLNVGRKDTPNPQINHLFITNLLVFL